MNNSSINIDPEIMSGAPVFTGTRVTIKTLFDYLEHGRSLEDFLQDYDWVSRESAVNVIELAKKIITDEKILRAVDENPA